MRRETLVCSELERGLCRGGKSSKPIYSEVGVGDRESRLLADG